MSEQKTLYLIGNAHIDPVWLWSWEEGFQEIKATFRSALDRMQEDPEFQFSASSAVFYEWVESNDPAMFQEIQQRVAEGRWCIVGGLWVEPDCNLPGGESFARHGLLSQRYFRQKFGTTARVGYNPDSFGHHGMLPQLLRLSGLDAYVFMRPGPHEKELASPVFWWESDDGSRVMAFRIPFSYGSSGADLTPHLERCLDAQGYPDAGVMCFFGVGNHGGGPTRENLDSIHRFAQAHPETAIRFSSPNQYFAEMVAAGSPDAWPTIHEELQHHASGCYAAHSAVKRFNRQTEQRLLRAEKFAVLAHLDVQAPYPQNLGEGWKNLLFNQFHDILAGTSIESAYEDARDAYGESQLIAARALNATIQRLSWNMDIAQEPEWNPLVVFHPHSFRALVPVEIEVGGEQHEVILEDDTGRSIPVQWVTAHAGAAGRRRFVFMADLPALGWQFYQYRSLETDSTQPERNSRLPFGCLETKQWRLQVDPTSGAIKSLFDRMAGTEVFSGPAALAIVADDLSDTWSHGVVSFPRDGERFMLESVEIVEDGAVKTVLRVRSRYQTSSLVQDFTLYPDQDQIDVDVAIDWHEAQKIVKLKFPVKVTDPTVTYEIPYGTIVRESNGDEQPAQSWLDVTGRTSSGDRYGVALLNDGKYSFDVLDSTMDLTVLRSPYYAHHDPHRVDPAHPPAATDQGLQRFRYTLVAHAGSWQAAGIAQKAMELNQPPVVVKETFHRGNLPLRAEHIVLTPPNLVMTALKMAEDGQGYVVRMHEGHGLETVTTVQFPRWQRSVNLKFRPFEIKTVYIPYAKELEPWEVNFLEDRMAEEPQSEVR